MGTHTVSPEKLASEVLERLHEGCQVVGFVQSGRIPAFKVGWVWRFREAEIRSWLEEHRQPDAAGAKKEAKRTRRRRAK